MPESVREIVRPAEKYARARAGWFRERLSAVKREIAVCVPEEARQGTEKKDREYHLINADPFRTDQRSQEYFIIEANESAKQASGGKHDSIFYFTGNYVL